MLCMLDYNNQFSYGCYRRHFSRPDTTFKYHVSKKYTHLHVASAPLSRSSQSMGERGGAGRRTPRSELYLYTRDGDRLPLARNGSI